MFSLSQTLDSHEVENVLSYTKDDVEYGAYVHEFLEDEMSFYSHIDSFSQERSTVLRILDSEGERISSAVLLSDNDDLTVLEVKRTTEEDFERKNHMSIVNWYRDVCGGGTSTTDLFDKIVIGAGDSSVPLWRVLETAMDEDHQKSIDEELAKRHDQVIQEDFKFILEITCICTILTILFSVILYSLFQN
jgi:hypothetical protein